MGEKKGTSHASRGFALLFLVSTFILKTFTSGSAWLLALADKSGLPQGCSIQFATAKEGTSGEMRWYHTQWSTFTELTYTKPHRMGCGRPFSSCLQVTKIVCSFPCTEHPPHMQLRKLDLFPPSERLQGKWPQVSIVQLPHHPMPQQRGYLLHTKLFCSDRKNVLITWVRQSPQTAPAQT